MRILYICRLYSGFEGSMKSGIWAPKGAPTIARMIECLDQSAEFEIIPVLTCKDYNSGWAETRDKIIKLEGLKTPVHVLAGKAFFPSWLWKFQEKFSDMRQVLKLWRLYRQTRPDLIFCDRVNVAPAAFFARLTKTPVIWRVMGILQPMHEALLARSWRATISRFLYRSPFAAVICTLDGSGGGPWMNKALNPRTQKHLLINGVDRDLQPAAVSGLPGDKTIVLFVGRLEHLKGAREFLEAFRMVYAQDHDFHAVLAGDGSLQDELMHMIREWDLQEAVTFLGAVSPAQLKTVRQNAHIYVSLNKQGNLSNVNLEALCDGMVCIVPSSQEDGTDQDTDHLIPEDVFYRFGRVGDAPALSRAILRFATPESRRSYQSAARALAQRILPTWTARLQQELQIYRDVVKG